jgi:hypothetical protein
VTINNLTGGVNSLNVLDTRLTEEAQRRREEDDKLSVRIHDIEKAQGRNNVMLGIFITIAVGLVVSFFRSLVSS